MVNGFIPLADERGRGAGMVSSQGGRTFSEKVRREALKFF